MCGPSGRVDGLEVERLERRSFRGVQFCGLAEEFTSLRLARVVLPS